MWGYCKAINDLLVLINALCDVDVERDHIDILSRYYKSVRARSLETLAPEISKEWHPTKNGDLKPSVISANMVHKVWWICPNGHDYPASPTKRYLQKRGCPYCTHQKVIPGETGFAQYVENLTQCVFIIEQLEDLAPKDVNTS